MALARVSRFEIRGGTAPTTESRIVTPSQVTLFIGPNNGGKSTALRDIADFANRNQDSVYGDNLVPPSPWPGGTVIAAVNIGHPSDIDEVDAFLADRIIRRASPNVEVRNVPISGMGGSPGIHVFDEAMLDPTKQHAERIAARLLQISTAMLNGRERFGLAQPGQLSDLQGAASNHWMAIERDPVLFDEVDRTISDAFQRHLVFQTFSLPSLVPALADAPLPPELRQSISPEAIQLQQNATPLNELSDGVQVFCGLIAALSVIPHTLILVDEPEAFLHPTLSRRLGAHLAKVARRRNARLFAATHSANFLLGCLDEVPGTTIVRLGYAGGVASSDVLASEQVAALARDPLTRSTSAMDALFARGAVVCEADSDRAFYEEINRRLVAHSQGGARDLKFLNAQNWQTTIRLAKPLRSAGVPAAVVLDLDTLVEDGQWSSFVEMAGVSSTQRDTILTARASARDAIRSCGKHSKDGPWKVKTEGLRPLDPDQRAVVETAIHELARIGIFIVPVGELEGWLVNLGCTNKQTWVTDMLGRMGTEGDSNYLHPAAGDVWNFVRSVGSWLTAADREGMAAA